MHITIVHCRPNQLGSELCQEAQANQIDCMHLPLFELQSAPLSQRVIQQVSSLTIAPKHIFVNQQAVLSALPYFKDTRLFCQSERCFSVGLVTLKQLQKYNFLNSIAPKPPYNSEALLDLTELQAVSQQPFIIWCGPAGRKLIKQTLIARSANVYEAEVYQRKPLNVDTHTLTHVQNLQQPIFLASSMYILKRLSKLFNPLSSDGILLTISERIVKSASQYSWKNIELLNSLDKREIIEYAKKLGNTN